MKKLVAILLVAMMAIGLVACDNSKGGNTDSSTTYKVGLCNYVSDASLDQICNAIQSELEIIGTKEGVTFDIDFQNAQADANVLSQIVTNYVNDNVDLMVGVATPVAMTMQGMAEEANIPVVFSAVSDPEGTGLVASMDAPGANVTGTSDMLDTASIIELIKLYKPDIKKVGLLYDAGQDASTKPIAEAKELLSAAGIEVVERTGTTVDEVTIAAQSLVKDGVEAVFTPTDNTIMQAELSIYEIFADAGIAHFAGADSFALNGAFLGYGVNYEELGRATARMVADILLNGKDPATTAVQTFDNGIATINTDICEKLGVKFDDMKAKFADKCSDVASVVTAESFE